MHNIRKKDDNLLLLHKIYAGHLLFLQQGKVIQQLLLVKVAQETLKQNCTRTKQSLPIKLTIKYQSTYIYGTNT